MIVTALKSFDHDRQKVRRGDQLNITSHTCPLYTSDDADDMQCTDPGGRSIINNKPHKKNTKTR